MCIFNRGALCVRTDRLFHENRALHKHVHAVHHSWVSTEPWSAFYAHPVEHALVNVLPILGPARLVGMSEYSFRVFMNTATFSVIVSHSAVLSAHARAPPTSHDLHHLLRTGNYRDSGRLDALFGTRLSPL